MFPPSLISINISAPNALILRLHEDKIMHQESRCFIELRMAFSAGDVYILHNVRASQEAIPQECLLSWLTSCIRNVIGADSAVPRNWISWQREV